MENFNVTFGEYYNIGRLEYWTWFLSKNTVEEVLNRKHLFGNFFWKNK